MVVATPWSKRNDIENFHYGLGHKLHRKEEWLWQRLVMEGVILDTVDNKREKCFQAYQAQKIFIMAQKQLMPSDWNPLDPIKSVKQDKRTGQFTTLQKIGTPVPENILTASFLRYAYGLKKETFRRWMGQGSKFPERIPVNKGKNIIEHIEFAEHYFTPKRLYMQHEMKQYMLTNDGRTGTKSEKQAHTRAFLKEHFKVLPGDVLDVYVKACRERMAYHGFIEEAIVDTLNDNNEQAFRQLDKVESKYFVLMFTTCPDYFTNCFPSMLMGGVAIRRLSGG
jgi:hypothetical protein